MNSELEGSGGTPEVTSDDFIGDDGIQWQKLARTIFVSFWFRLSVAVAGLIELVFGLLSSAYETIYGAYEAFIGLSITGWASLIETSWDAAGQSLAESFGLLAWFVAVVVIAAFFYAAGRALQTLIEGVTP